MKNYELMFILKPNLTEEDRKKTIDIIKNIIVEGGGEITREEDWGKRTLAYEIQKFTEGFYILLNFSAPPNIPLDLETRMRHTETILRWLIIKLDRELRKPEKLEKKRAKKTEETMDF